MEKLKKLSREEMKKIFGGNNKLSFPVCDATCSSDGTQCGERGCVCSYVQLEENVPGDYVCY